MSTNHPPRLHGVFIGINRHAHQQVHDLCGAVQDARALAAIFADSYPRIDAQQLLDARATRQSVSAAIQKALANATADDLVIISFSGHGTPGHYLVTHDTDPDELAATAIEMNEIADQFTASAAKAIMVILDCCFSGKAPARVFAQTSRMRNISSSAPTTLIMGKGRAILSASAEDKPAWESTEHNHGLLTHAFIETLTALVEPSDIAQIMTTVMHKVGAFALRIGQTQSPTLNLNIDGRLTLHPLIKGERYYAEFPEYAAVTVGSDVRDLAALGIPGEVIDEWSTQFTHLNDLQVDAVNVAGVLRGESVCVIAPTSSGKTFIGELAAIKAAMSGRKSVFLVPYKALANEHHDRFARVYGQHLDLRVIRCTGDYSDSAPQFILGKYDLAILTYEMFLSLALANQASLTKIGLVVVDEAHFIANPTRGITIELLLAMFRRNRGEGIGHQLLLLSAVVGHSQGFEDWLGCKLLRRDHRPVPLTEGVIDRSGTYQHRTSASTEEREQLLEPDVIVQRKQKPSAQDIIVPLVRKLVGAGEKVIVFRNTRGAASGCATYLAQELTLPAAQIVSNTLPTQDFSATTRTLREALAGGVAFHTSDLNVDERRVIERAFCDPDGPVRVLVATTTVAAGVNLPADTVVLVEHEFPGQERRPYTVAEYKNMAGRAGRMGLSQTGRAVLIASNSLERDHLYRSYVTAPMSNLSSSFSEANLDSWIIRLLGQTGELEYDAVSTLLVNTFGGHLCQRADPDWPTRVVPRIAKTLERFSRLELIERHGSCVRLSLLGRACACASLTLDSALNLVALIKERWRGELSPEALAIALQATADMEGVYCPYSSRQTAERTWVNQLPGQGGKFLQFGANDTSDWMRRCKRALIVIDWANGVPIEIIESRYTTHTRAPISYGDIQRITNATRYHLRSAHELLMIAAPERAPNVDDIQRFLARLEFGISEQLLWLLELSVDLSRGEMLTLARRGVTDLPALTNLAAEDLAAIIGDVKAEALVAPA